MSELNNADAPAIAGRGAGDRDIQAHSYDGTCNVCGWSGAFIRAHYSPREGYACSQCRSSLRYRAQADAILGLFAEGRIQTLSELATELRLAEKTLYEPGVTGPFRKIFKGLPNYEQSFYWEDVAVGDQRDGIICQDLTRTTYPDQSFDLVITSDIFEHIRHPVDGFREISRILKPGGCHVWSVPAIEPLPQSSVSRIDTSTETDVPILPLVYHGSGMSGGRSVVYTDFGADILETLAAIHIPTEALRYQPTSELRALITFVSRREG